MNPSSNPSVFIDITPNLHYDMGDLIRARIRASLARLHATPGEIHPGDTVAIKINLTIPAPPELAVTTHPLLLRAIILELQSLGATITVVEDCEPEAVSVSGTAAVLAETGVSFINLRERDFQPVASNPTIYSYATDILNTTHLISIPKLKTHLYTYYTGAIKNMFGCIPKSERRELHREMATPRFSEHLVNIYAFKRPTLVILDGILAMEGIGPTQGIP
ncbi:MAG TPA: DUF362 domain-containing protein, partial [Bacillota bacterium]|nr:DUF362 domain-containing protein [Bacillota bacterium]